MKKARRNHPNRTVPALAAILLLSPLPALAEEPPETDDSLRAALEETSVVVSLRYRFESVDDAALARDAAASTLRTSLAVATRPYKGLRLFAEAENVAAVGDDDYNNGGAGSLNNNVRDRPVVADPAITELNQIYLELANDETKARLGRQEITLDDVRFVGNVGWRQNHQSFDALTVERHFGPRVRFFYAYLDAVHRIFGDSLDLAGHVARAKVDLGGGAHLRLYGVLLDYDLVVTASTDTWGAEIAGKRKIGEGPALLYELEYATQGDSGDNPFRVDADYAHVSLGGSWPRLTARVGRESLEGSGRDGQFSTPLATLHKFNGWADRFLRTPVNGLEDTYLALAGKAGKVAWTGVWHSFAATTGGDDYGEELDVQVTYKTSWGQVLALKAALYDADRFSTDVDKLFFWTSYSFP